MLNRLFCFLFSNLWQRNGKESASLRKGSHMYGNSWLCTLFCEGPGTEPCLHPRPPAFSLPLEVKQKQNKTKSKDIKQVSVKLKTGKQMVILGFYLLFLQAQVTLLDIVVKNENLLWSLSITFGNLSQEHSVTEKLPEVKKLKSRIMRQLLSGKTLTTQPKVGHRIWLGIQKPVSISQQPYKIQWRLVLHFRWGSY